MKKLTFENLKSGETLAHLISQRESFEVIALGGKLLEAVQIIENKIESADLTCRVYTSGRVAIAVGSTLGSFGIGALSTLGIAAHNLVTWNPDYEIEKVLTHNKIVVKYRKKI